MAFVRNCFKPSGNELRSLRKAGLGKRKVVFKNKHRDHKRLSKRWRITFQGSWQYLINSYITIRRSWFGDIFRREWHSWLKCYVSYQWVSICLGLDSQPQLNSCLIEGSTHMTNSVCCYWYQFCLFLFDVRLHFFHN